MGAALGPRCTQALQDRRHAFNAAFAQARRQYPRLDGDAVLQFVGAVVAPLVEAVEPSRTSGLLDALFDTALHLMGAELLGRGTALDALWTQVFPALSERLAADPRPLVAALSNAAVNISRTPGTRPAEWLKTLEVVGPFCEDAGTLLKVGQVAAWRAGMAHYREGALATAAQLSPPLCRLALGLRAEGESRDLLARLAADRWRSPGRADEDGRQLQIVSRVGGFRGFGGPFVHPPRVVSDGRAIYLACRDESWLLCADACGSTLHRSPLPATTASGALSVGADGEVRYGALRRTLPRLADATSHASTGDTLAVTVPWSHWVYLVALGPQL